MAGKTVFLLFVLFSVPAWGGELLFSCCMSLRAPLVKLSQQYEMERGVHVRINAASSGKLALQIEEGAPVDLFVSASPYWIDSLVKAGFVDSSNKVEFLGNRLAVVAPKNSALISFGDLAKVSRIAIGDYRFAPFGQYAKETLISLGMWKTLKPRIVLANNVVQAITWLVTGEVDAGIIYYSDYLRYRKRLSLVKIFPETLHSPIRYWLAMLKGSNHKGLAIELERFLCSSNATTVFLRYGFSIPEKRRCP